MAGDEYSSAIGGGLKLKGAKPSGVKKKKKAKKDKSEDEAKKSALQKALEDEDADIRAEDIENEEGNGDGKTETERRHEEMKRKRVSARFLRCHFRVVYWVFGENGCKIMKELISLDSTSYTTPDLLLTLI